VPDRIAGMMWTGAGVSSVVRGSRKPGLSPEGVDVNRPGGDGVPIQV
jgi:hypothetical protein